MTAGLQTEDKLPREILLPREERGEKVEEGEDELPPQWKVQRYNPHHNIAWQLHKEYKGNTFPFSHWQFILVVHLVFASFGCIRLVIRSS